MVSIAPSPAANTLRVGTPVLMRVMENLTTEGKKLRVGQRVQMEVAENVMLNSMVVVPAGTPAMAEVTDVRNKGMWGKSGHMTVRLLYARLGDRQIRLSGTFDDKGVSGTAGVVAALAVVPVAGFFVTGTSARIPAGSQVKGFLDEDLMVAASAAPTPIVPASAAPTTAGK